MPTVQIPHTDLKYATLAGVEPSEKLSFHAQQILSMNPDEVGELDSQALTELFLEEATGGLDKTGDLYFGKPYNTHNEKLRAIQHRLNPQEFEAVRLSPIDKYRKLKPEQQRSEAVEWLKQNKDFQKELQSGYRDILELGEINEMTGQNFQSITEAKKAQRDNPSLFARMNLQSSQPVRLSSSHKMFGSGANIESMPDEFIEHHIPENVIQRYEQSVLFPQDYEAVRTAYEKQLPKVALEYARDYMKSGVHVPEIYKTFPQGTQEALSRYLRHVTPYENPSWLKEQAVRFGGATGEQIENVGEGVGRPIIDTAALAYAWLGNSEKAGELLFNIDNARRVEHLNEQSSSPKFKDRFEYAGFDEGLSSGAGKYAVRGLEGLIESLPFTATAAIPVVGLGLAAVGEGNRISNELIYDHGIEPTEARNIGYSAGIAMGFLERVQIGKGVDTGKAIYGIIKNAEGRKSLLKFGEAVTKGYSTQVIQESAQEFVEAVAPEIATGDYDVGRATAKVIEALPDILATSAWFGLLFGGAGAYSGARQEGRNQHLGMLKGSQEWSSIEEANDLKFLTDQDELKKQLEDAEVINSGQFDGEGAMRLVKAYIAEPDHRKNSFLQTRGIEDPESFKKTVSTYITEEREVQSIIRDDMETELLENKRNPQPIVDPEIIVDNRVAEAQELSTRFQEVFPRALPIQIVTNDQEFAEAIGSDQSGAKAAITGDRVVVNIAKIKNKTDFVRQLAHEQLAHHGLDIRGDEGRRLVLDEFRKAIEATGADINFIKSTLPEYAKIEQQLRERGGENVEQKVDDLYLEEFIARTAEKIINGETLSVEEQSVFDKVVEWLRGVLGFDESQVDADEISQITAGVVRDLARGLQDVSQPGGNSDTSEDKDDDLEGPDDIPFFDEDVADKPDVSPDSENKPLSVLEDLGRYPVQQVRVSDIKADPRRFQFKRDVNESGEQKELEGEWNDTAAGNLLLWEDASGQLYVANGHHRFAHAERFAIEWLNAQVLRESEGWSDIDAFAKAAEDNILDGKGTIYDHAEYFRNTRGQITEELATSKGLRGSGFQIGQLASDNTYSTFLAQSDGQGNSVTADRIFSIIKGAGGNTTAQDIALTRVGEQRLTNQELQQYAATMAASLERGDAPISSGDEMGDLFGDSSDADVKAWEETQRAIAKQQSKMLREVRDELKSIEGTVKTDSRVEKAKKSGVKVSNVEKARGRVAYLRDRESAILRSDQSIVDEAENRLRENVRFSLEGPVETNRNLVALHNLTEDKLKFSDELGGLPVPSIAVVTKGRTLNNFGEISLIGRRGLVDPERDPVFDADAYTNRFPDFIYPKPKAKEQKEIRDFLDEKVTELKQAGYVEANRYGNETFPLAVSLGRDKVYNGLIGREGTRLPPDPGEIIDGAYNNNFLMALFVKHVGEDFSPVLSHKGKMDRRDIKAKLRKIVDDRMREYESWIQDFIAPYTSDPMVMVGRKKMPATLHNIVDAMSSRNVKGGEDTSMSEGRARAIAAQRFHDMASLRSAASDNIRDAHEIESEREKVQAQLEGLRSEALEYYYDPDRVFQAYDEFMEALARSYAKGKGKNHLRAELRKREFDGGADKEQYDEFLDRALKVRERFMNVPVPYFEAKPQRAVRLKEFAGAVIPQSASDETRRILEKNGLQIKEYNNLNYRRDVAVNVLAEELEDAGTDIRFSLTKDEVSQIDQTDTPDKLLAPNGNPSNLNERQWKQVRTSAFKKWFGDWENDPENASKVVDENGEPLVVYHGTASDFARFDIGETLSNFGIDIDSDLAFFTDSVSTAAYYASEASLINFQETEPDYKEDFNASIMPVFLNMKDPFTTYLPEGYAEYNKTDSDFINLLDFVDTEKFDIVSDLRDEELDGFIAKGREQSVYAIHKGSFNAGRDGAGGLIKSASGNQGTYDGSNSDIRFSLEQDSSPTRNAALVLSKRAVEGKVVDEKDAARLLPDADESTLRKVVIDSLRIANAVEEQLENYRDDKAINSALRDQEIVNYYRELVDTVAQQGELRGELLQRARTSIQSRKITATKAKAKAVNGLTIPQMDGGEESILSKLDNALVPDLLNAKPKEKVEEEVEEEVGEEAEAPENKPVKRTAPRPEGRSDSSESSQRWVQETKDRVIQELINRGEIKSRTKTSEKSAMVREALKKTLVTALDSRVRQLTYGADRERLNGKLKNLSSLSTMPGVENNAARLVDLVNLYSVRDNKQTIIEEIERLLDKAPTSIFSEKTGRESEKKIGQFSPLTEKEKRIITPRVQQFVIQSKKAMRMTEPAVIDRLFELEKLINGDAPVPENQDEHEYKEDLMQEFRALKMFGALSSDVKPVADVAQARDDLDKMIRESFLEIERLRFQREERLKRKRDIWNRAMDAAITKRGPGKNSALSNVILDVYMLESFLYDAIRFSNDPEAKKLVQEIMSEIVQSDGQEKIGGLNKRQFIDQQVTRIYGKKAKTAYRELREAKDEYKKFSKHGRGLSKANLIQIYGTMQQSDYRNQLENESLMDRLSQMEEIASTFTKEDFEFLQFVIDFNDRERDALSKATEEVTGIGFKSPDINYIPVKMEYDNGGMASIHKEVSYVPKTLTPRVKSNADLDETADITRLLFQRLDENEHFKAYGQTNIELRGIFASRDVRLKTELAMGSNFRDRLWNHISSVQAGKAFNEGQGGEIAQSIAGTFSVMKLAGNIETMAKQPLSIGAFMMKIGTRDFTRHMKSAFTSEGIQRMKHIWDSDFRKERMTGSFQDSVQVAFEKAERSGFKKLDPIIDLFKAMMITNSFGDILPTLVIGQGIYQSLIEQPEIQAMGKEAGEFRAMAELFHIVEMTQQSTRMKDLNALRRSKGVGRFFTTFQSTPMQYASGYFQAWRQFSAIHGSPLNPKNLPSLLKGGTEAARNFRRQVILHHVVLPGMWSLGNMVIRGILGDSPDEDDVKLMAAGMLTGPFSGLLFFGSIAQTASEKIFGYDSYFDKSLVPAEGLFDDVDNLGELGWSIIEGDGEDVMANSHDLIRSVFSPYRTISKVVENYSE